MKKELMKLHKEQLVHKCISLYSNYNNAMSRYRNLKADILLIKSQLNRISEGIQYTSKDRNPYDKGNSNISYFPGGKRSKKVKGR